MWQKRTKMKVDVSVDDVYNFLFLSVSSSTKVSTRKQSKSHCVKPGDATGTQRQSLKFAHEAMDARKDGVNQLLFLGHEMLLNHVFTVQYWYMINPDYAGFTRSFLITYTSWILSWGARIFGFKGECLLAGGGLKEGLDTRLENFGLLLWQHVMMDFI